jgi:gingipain R
MTSILTESYPTNKKITLGGLFYNSQLSMLENYPGADGEEVMQTWVFFGDPSTEFRNKITQELIVNHISQIAQSETQLNISSNQELATIAVSQNNVLLAKGLINAGNVNLTLPTLTSNSPLTVTGTKQNFKAYQGNIQVGNGPLALDENDFELLSVFPNPTVDLLQINIQCQSKTTITMLDLSGKTIQSKDLQIGTSLEQIDLSAIARGIYQLKIQSQKAQKLVKIVKD